MLDELESITMHNDEGDPHWELICYNKWHPGTSKISIPLEIAVGAHFHGSHGTITAPVFLPADGEASWSLLLSLASLLSGSTVHPENTYSYILKVTGQVSECQNRISINTNTTSSKAGWCNKTSLNLELILTNRISITGGII